jgi:hypothetical protein
MNEPYDPLEAELVALAPREPSPELKARIAAELADGVSAPLRAAKRTTAQRVWILSIAAALAACLLVAVLARRGELPRHVAPPDEFLHPSLANAFDESLPTVWTYRRAVYGSPQEMDDLLDKHASSEHGPASQRLNVSAFPMSSTNLQSLLGDL